MKRITFTMLAPVLALTLLAGATPVAQAAEDSLSMQQLLQEVKRGRMRDAEENKRREADFLADQAQQDAKIRAAEQRIASLEARSEQLEKVFNANELKVEEKRAQRDERLGSLKELFGHLTGAAGDLRTRFRMAVTTSEFQGRDEFLKNLIVKMNNDTELPTIEEIENLWFEMHRELTETGRVVKYPAKVGTEEGREIVRIGMFNLVSNGDYLAYDEDTRGVSVLPRQPDAYTSGAAALQQATSGFVAVGLDPTGAAGGGYLKALINTPTLVERWHQGGLVGYVITAVGLAGLLVALWRFTALQQMTSKVNRQRSAESPTGDNPLGRVLLTGAEHAGEDVETLELKLGEAIIKERPAIQRGLPLLKIIAMVAPLLGLLGTVTGMIIVFQAITIYGAGDPKAMAGGISSALVTTVLGLIVAIPTLLLHTLLQGRAKSILHVLEEQTAGLVAQRAGR